jgi:hypothetical protein
MEVPCKKKKEKKHRVKLGGSPASNHLGKKTVGQTQDAIKMKL